MRDLNHLKQSVLLRQSGELAERESAELDQLLGADRAAAAFARDAQTVVTVYRQTTRSELPATPDFSLERILREGRAARPAPAPSLGTRLRQPLQWAAAAAVLAVIAGTAVFYLRGPATSGEVATAHPAPVAAPASDLWASFESDDLDLRLASLHQQVKRVAAGETEEDALARELLQLETDSVL